jgi:RNA polymerase sigma-70 factor (ECF subfamily)
VPLAERLRPILSVFRVQPDYGRTDALASSIWRRDVAVRAGLEPRELETSAGRLVGRCLRGDREAFGLVYDLYAKDVHRFLFSLRLPLGPQQIEDAVQEAFLRLFQRLHRCDRSRIRGFLFGIARNVAVDVARSERGSGGERAVARRAKESPLKAAVRGEEGALIAKALSSLEPEQRTVLALRHQARLTMADLGIALECSVPTARARLNEATSRLAIELRHLGLDPKELY